MDTQVQLWQFLNQIWNELGITEDDQVVCGWFPYMFPLKVGRHHKQWKFWPRTLIYPIYN